MPQEMDPASCSDHPSQRIVEVTFNIPLERSFHYSIPPALQGCLRPGMRVLAPFGRRELVGFAVQLLSRSPIRELKAIRRVCDPIPMIADERWALASWLSRYNYCSLGEALSAMVPTTLRLTGDMSVSERIQPPESAGRLALTSHQEGAFRIIATALDRLRFATILLHGVTGSGKTELYLQAIERALHQRRGAICLVPEIALTPQTIDRFRERFGERIAVWHSRLTARQRVDAWRGLVSGQYWVAVGTRSAVFLPVPRLGLIILDEEHERTYKQEDTPAITRVRSRGPGAS